MKTEVQTPPDKTKIPLPTLSQINADRITQVCINKKVIDSAKSFTSPLIFEVLVLVI